jgi:hypothetical protein
MIELTVLTPLPIQSLQIPLRFQDTPHRQRVPRESHLEPVYSNILQNAPFIPIAGNGAVPIAYYEVVKRIISPLFLN